MSEKDTLIDRLEELVPSLLSVAQAKGNIPNDLAYDAIQDIAVGLLARSPTFRDQQHFKAYITKVFYYRILDRVKISGKFTSLDSLSEESVSPSQEKMTYVREILELIKKLPAKQKEVMLRVIQGKSDTTIAGEINVSPATVRSHKRFARGTLANLLAEEEG